MNYFTETVLKTLEKNLATDKRLDSLERLTRKVTDTGTNLKSLLTDIDIHQIKEENSNFSKGLIKAISDFEHDHEIDDRHLSLACHHVLHDEYDFRKVITISESPDYKGLESYVSEFNDSLIAHYKHSIFDASVEKLWVKQNINPGDDVSIYLKKELTIGGVDLETAIKYIGSIENEKNSDKYIEKYAKINFELGIHARPSSIICQIANSYENDIFIRNSTKNEEVNAKSLLGLLSLNAAYGDEVIIKGKYDSSDEIETCKEFVKRIEFYLNGDEE